LKYLDTTTPIADLDTFLRQLKWVSDETITGLETPGAGNMNVVIRVTTDKRSFIIKQSRPYVEKYQDIPAPADRIDVEYQFYKATDSSAASKHMPTISAYAPDHHLIMMEDLGNSEDMTAIYQRRQISDTQLRDLVHISKGIHNQRAPQDFPENLELRRLNHQHIFVLPYMEDNGFDLDGIQPGLQALSMSYKRDDHLKAAIQTLGDGYLSSGDTLIHGDYYPGSWMQIKDKIYIIDPEFSYVGDAAFDLGVMAAHIIMATSDVGYLTRIITLYDDQVDLPKVQKIAGVEIMRRLIGLAQLPLRRSLTEKEGLLQLAHRFILGDG